MKKNQTLIPLAKTVGTTTSYSKKTSYSKPVYNKNFFSGFVFLLSFCYAISSLAQGPNWQMAKKVGGNKNDYATAVAVDAGGNTYFSGYYNSVSLILGNTVLSNSGTLTFDMFLVKYDAAGNVLWAKNAGGSNDDYAYSLAVDKTGNVYMTGYFKSSSVTFGSYTLTTNGSFDIFLVKYDAAGNVLWAKSAGGNMNDVAVSVATDVSGNIIVCGSFNSSSINFGTVTLNNAGSSNIYMVKYTPDGNVLWAKSAGGTASDYSSAVATDKSGNIYITGGFGSTSALFDTITVTNDTTNNSTDVFIAKYNASGNAVWAKSAGGSEADDATSIAVDASDNIYVSGNFSSRSIGFDALVLTGTKCSMLSACPDMFIVKIDASGNAKWAKKAGGGGIDESNSVTVDGAANVYVTGGFTSFNMSFGTVTISLTASSFFSDIFIAKFDSSGIVKWAKKEGNVGYDYAYFITADASDNIYVAGSFLSPDIKFGSITLTNDSANNSSDCYVAKFNATTGIAASKNNADNIQWTLYPNPATGKFTIYVNNDSRKIIEIYNVLGEKVFQSETTEKSTNINITYWTSGVYFVRLQTDGKNYSQTISIR